jgi:hypothetical protein
MVPGFLKYFFAFLTTGFLVLPNAFSQNLTGIWRGYFVTESAEQYKFELQIEQSPGKSVSGVSYSYLSTRFYGKATLTGNYNAKSNMALVQEIKTVELRMSGGSVACIMKCLLQYEKSGEEEFLEGSYTSKYEKSDSLLGIMRGGGCGGGKVFLRKVVTSDFYVEPFLRDKPTVKRTAPQSNSVTKTTPPKTTTNKPATKPATKSKPQVNTPSKPVVKKPAPAKPVVTNKPKPDTVQKTSSPAITKEEVKKPAPVSTITVPAKTRSRENELLQTINVTSNEVIVRLYDNGEIDDDTISVYMNNNLVLSNKRLSASPLSITLKLDDNNPEHVLVMVAENLGRIPPNTSLMIVQDGEKKYQVRITSTNQKNAMVRFRYQGS